MRGTQAPYLSRLDHLRFFAAALVVAFHFFHTRHGDLRSGNPLVSLIDEGHSGIALFMVISGFIFAHIVGDRTIDYWGFIRNRVLRIYPLFVFAVVLQLFISTYNDHRNYGFLQLLGWLMPFRSETVPLSPQFVQLWSIWVEFQFYLIFPFLWAFTQRRGWGYLAGWLGLLLLVRALVYSATGSVRYIAYETIFGRLDQFIVGMLLAQAWASRPVPVGGMSPLWAIGAGLLVLLGLHAFSLSVGFTHIDHPAWVFWPLAEACLWAAFLWGYLRARGFGPQAWRRRFDRTLAGLGTVSFSVYVMHNLVIQAIAPYITGVVLPWGPVVNAIALGLGLVVPLVLAVSGLTYRLIESPFLSLRQPYCAAAPSQHKPSL